MKSLPKHLPNSQQAAVPCPRPTTSSPQQLHDRTPLSQQAKQININLTSPSLNTSTSQPLLTAPPLPLPLNKPSTSSSSTSSSSTHKTKLFQPRGNVRPSLANFKQAYKPKYQYHTNKKKNQHDKPIHKTFDTTFGKN